MNGIIIINKTKGYTSHDIVYKVKRMFNEKVGHTGTLDPLATGVLPILIGKGTQCSKYLINHDKIYDVTLQLGVKMDSADGEGDEIETKEVGIESLEEKNVLNVLEDTKGKQMQTPPMYSAIKVNGKKLYEYARKGEKVEIKPREIEIYDIDLLKINIEEKQIEFRVKCSKGTYIRSLSETIAEKLNTVGYMKELNRIKVGEFDINKSITIEDLQKNIENEEFINRHIITLEKIFEKNEKIVLNDKKLTLFLNGVKLTYNSNEGIYKIYNNSEFIGTGIIKDNILKRDIIL